MRAHALAGCLVLALVAPSGEVWAREASTSASTAERGRFAVARAAGRGLKTGFSHTLHSIRPLPRGATNKDGKPLSLLARWKKPLVYTAMVGGIFAAGAAAQAVHINPAPYMISLSGAAYAYQLKTRALPKLRGTTGLERVETFTAEVVYPGLLVVGSTLGGMALGHGGEGAATAMDTAHQGHEAVHHATRTSAIVSAGAQSAVIGIDVPTIVQGAADHDGMGPASSSGR